MQDCWFCFDNPKLDKHLIISLGNFTYLALPKRGSLTPGHCFLVPMQHSIASNVLDEEIWEELQSFKKCLVKMFGSKNQDVLFMETVQDLKRQRHTYIECIPIGYELGEKATMYFKVVPPNIFFIFSSLKPKSESHFRIRIGVESTQKVDRHFIQRTE